MSLKESTFPAHIAVWSGPRNISTALMRSWSSRDDTFVCDEPLYAHYLEKTGLGHPGRDEVISSHDADYDRVVEWLTSDIPDGKSIFYQKHMAHHLLPGMKTDWVAKMRNAFLIRKPSEMLTSLIKVTPSIRIEDTGLPQQWQLFQMLEKTIGRPPVLDARDVLEAPRAVLEKLCEALGVPFSTMMLSWKAGRRETDGVWAKYWYSAVEQSTGFEPYRPKDDAVPETLMGLHDECYRFYESLYRHRITW